MFVFLVYSIVFWWFSSKGWDTSWHFQMQHNQAKFSDIHFLSRWSSTHITATTTDESFIFTSSALKVLREVSHESFFIFTSSTFSSNNSFRKLSRLSPAMFCACCLLILDEQRAPRKTNFQRAMVRVIVFGTPGWIKKICETMILENPVWKMLPWTKLEAAVENEKHKPKGIEKKSGI